MRAPPRAAWAEDHALDHQQHVDGAQDDPVAAMTEKTWPRGRVPRFPQARGGGNVR